MRELASLIKNAKSLPQVFFGLHMVPGVAEYAEEGQDPYRIYIGETTIKNMNPSFRGKPVYVDHVEGVNLDNLEEEMDGVVVGSFYNKADGMNWVQFVVTSDAAKEAIKMGWKLSNAYIPTAFSSGGENHGVQYLKEVTGGEYEHLAIVQNPRYEESIILTPEEFNEYNREKEVELARLANSKTNPNKETSKMKLNIFKRTKVENSVDLDGLMVELPKTKKEMKLSDVVSEFDAIQNMNGYANGDHMVKVGEDEMSVNDLVKKHIEMQNAQKEKEELENADDGEPGAEMENDDMDDNIDDGISKIDRGGDPSLTNEEEEEDEVPPAKKKNAKLENEKKVLARAKAAALKNAGPARSNDEVAVIDMAEDQVARGKARYGS